MSAALRKLAEMSWRAESGGLRQVTAWLRQIGHDFGVPAEPLHRIDVCLHEALANILEYGGINALSNPVELSVDVRHESARGEAIITVIDAGHAFDPLAAPTKPPPRTLADAEPGGLGLLMLRQFSDQLSYCYCGERNQLTFAVHWSGHRL